MARARNIKPGFFKNEDLAECSPWARLCFIGLWTLADRDGRMEDRAKRIKAELFAYDSVEVEPLLVELSSRGFILRYRDANGLGLIQVLMFKKHQTPHHKEARSILASPQSLGLLGDEFAGEAQVEPESGPGISLNETDELGVETHLNPDSLIPDTGFSDSSEAKASAALPAKEKPKPDPEKQRLWREGKALLVADGLSVAEAGKFIGKLAVDYPEIVKDAVDATLKATPPDPRAYLVATCQRLAGERNTVQSNAAAKHSEWLASEAARETGITPEQIAGLRAAARAAKVAGLNATKEPHVVE